MSRNNKYRFLVVVLILIVLFSSVSCKKKEASGSGDPQSLVSTTANTSDNGKSPLIVVPNPFEKEEGSTVSTSRSLEEKNAEPNKETTAVDRPAEKIEAPSNTLNKEMEVKSNDKTIDPAPITEEKSSGSSSLVTLPQEINNAIPQVVSMLLDEKGAADSTDAISVSQELVETEMAIEAESEGVDYTFAGIKAKVIAGTSSTTVEFIDEKPEEVYITTFIVELYNQYPDILSDCIYTYSDDVLTIEYPENKFGGIEDIYSLFDTLSDISSSIIADLDTIVDDESVAPLTADYLVYGKKVHVEAFRDHAILTSSAQFTKEEIGEAIEIIKANLEESAYVFYSIHEDRIELNYPEVDEEYIQSAFAALGDLILAYTPMPLTEEVEAVSVSEESVDTQVASIPLETDDKSSLKALDTINRFSVALSLDNELNFSYPDSPYVLAMEGRVEYSINKNFSMGLSFAYDLSGYMPISLYAKYIPFDNGLYFKGSAGISIGMAGRETGISLGLGLGYEVEVSEDFYIFGELSGEYRSNSLKKIVPALNIGIRYQF